MHYFMLFAAGMTRNVYVFQPFVHHVRAEMIQLVYYAVDVALVARDGRRGDDYRVVAAHGQGGIFAVGHAVQGAHGLALTARAHYQHLVVAQAARARDIHYQPFGYGQLAYLLRRFDHVEHAAAVERQPAPVAHGDIHYLLQPVHV